MKPKREIQSYHPMGEFKMVPQEGKKQAIPVDTYGGRVHVEWDTQAAVTGMGQLPFFIEFLETADLFKPWVNDCPLTYTSPNAPLKVNVLGTLMLSALSGHRRYTHITVIRCDSVKPHLLGMTRVVSKFLARCLIVTRINALVTGPEPDFLFYLEGETSQVAGVAGKYVLGIVL